MRDLNPTGYDPEKCLVLTEGGACKEAWFIEQAVLNVQRYDKPDLMLWAIDNKLPGLLENENARDLISTLVAGEKLRGRGEKAGVNLATDELHDKIFALVWFYHGRGAPIYIGKGSLSIKSTACDFVAHDLGCSASTAYKVWKQAGGHNPTGTLKVISKLYYEKGRQEISAK